MSRDILTMVWKEWREILLQRGTLRGGFISSIVIPIALMGVIIPWQSGRHWVGDTMVPVMWTWLPLMLVATMVCESFAGERERHTLESLLASRLSDTTILFGKMAGAIGYAGCIALVSLALGLLTVNLVHGHGQLLMLPLNTIAMTLMLSLLGSALAASAGVLISLRAATVRQAQQTLSLALMILIFGAIFGLRALPADWRVWFMRTFAGGNLLKTEIAVTIVLLTADLALAASAMARFKRTRLVLD